MFSYQQVTYLLLAPLPQHIDPNKHNVTALFSASVPVLEFELVIASYNYEAEIAKYGCTGRNR
jgi:hypothetical protein